MKKLFILFAISVAIASCGNNKSKVISQTTVIGDGLKFCESVLIDSDRIIVPNFGGEELNPLNTEGQGYIAIISDTTTSTLIPASGVLSAPKGTLIKDNRLFIADVNKLVVYNMDSLSVAPQVISFPEGDIFVNDIAASGNRLFITVTNSGNIYSLEINPGEAVDSSALTFYTNVPGANGIVINGNTMYIASYPADGITTEDNVIYVIEDINTPEITKLTDKAGQYDGLALNEDGTKLYYTSWVNGEVGYYDFATKAMVPIDLGIKLDGPARIAYSNGKLYIPDLPNSNVIIYQAQ